MSWTTTTIGSVCLPTSQRNPTSEDGSFRYIDIAGIDREAKTVSQANAISCAEAPSRARKEVRAGDVIVSMVRPNLNAIALVPEELDGEIASTGFAVLRADPKLVDFRYLFYGAQHREFVDYLVANATGASYPAVSDNTVRRASLPLPPLSEQARIVDLLDEADRLRKLGREADAKAARILSALFLKMFGDPESWHESETEPLGQLVSIHSGGTPSKAVPEFWEGVIPWVSPKDMKHDFLNDTEDHITTRAIEGSATRLIEEQSVLVVVRGMILARYVPIAMNIRAVAINQDIKALTLVDERISPLFLFAALKVLAPRLFVDVSTAAHGTKKLETARLAALRIPMPSKQQVERFTCLYEQLITIDRARTDSVPRIESLFSLLLQRAFSGQLTARWRQAHMHEHLAEMQEQARLLHLPTPVALQGREDASHRSAR